MNCLSNENSERKSGHPCADSINGGLGCHDIEMPGAFSRSSSEASKSGVKVSALTERIMVDNLLPILNVDSDEVRAKTSVVIEMLVTNSLVDPSLFCDDR